MEEVCGGILNKQKHKSLSKQHQITTINHLKVIFGGGRVNVLVCVAHNIEKSHFAYFLPLK